MIVNGKRVTGLERWQTLPRVISVTGLVMLLAACSAASLDPTQMKIVEDVDAVEPTRFAHICIEVNTNVKPGFTDRLFATVRELGFSVQSRQTAFGSECGHWMSYRVTWGGFPEYMISAEIKMFHHREPLGYVRYDATSAAGRPDRLGSAMGKLRPLVNAMLAHVDTTATAGEADDIE